MSANCTRLILAGALSAGLASPAFAGAWLQKPGHAQLIVTTSYYQTQDYFDDGGHLQSQSAYRKAEINPYVEYGFSENWTLGASLSLQAVSQSGQRNAALGDSEWFARRLLWRNEQAVLSAKPFVKIPGLDDSLDAPVIASTHPDFGLGLAAGHNLTLFGLPAFADAELAYRARLGSSHDQITFAPTLGLRASERWLLMPQIFSTWRVGSVASSATFADSPSNDYDLIKAQFSGVYRLDENYSLQSGVFYNVAGRNTGQGGGILFGLWREF